MKYDYKYVELLFIKNIEIVEISLIGNYFYITDKNNNHLKCKKENLMVRKFD